ncbi:YbfB/YjiJ family MFS transporter [Dactylosporangium roseum]|uniref:YbfB/YjiJ family MFS transporter n=1 Tax=Dactylosporangium roseum TaxID=47989 RepID=A0ABY5ZIM4_9ACTN|nr:YbfB/YjiJ family MFS transporter [Dactylosporangium roseum]
MLGLAVLAGPHLWSRPAAAWPHARTLATLLTTVSAAAAAPLLTPAPAMLIASPAAYGAAFLSVPAAITTLVRDTTTHADRMPTLAAFTACSPRARPSDRGLPAGSPTVRPRAPRSPGRHCSAP